MAVGNQKLENSHITGPLSDIDLDCDQTKSGTKVMQIMFLLLT